MKQFWKWFFIVLGALIVIGIAFGITLFFVRGGFGNYPANGMMGSFGRQPRLFGGSMLGMGLSMLFHGLFGLGILVLAGFGVAYLVKQPARSAMTPPQAMTVCEKCGSPLAPDWKACPHCGTAVKTK